MSQDVLLAITFDLEKLELKPLFFSKPPELVTDKFSVALSLEVKEKVGLIIKRYLSLLFFPAPHRNGSQDRESLLQRAVAVV